jgi:hypothetical protein
VSSRDAFLLLVAPIHYFFGFSAAPNDPFFGGGDRARVSFSVDDVIFVIHALFVD